MSSFRPVDRKRFAVAWRVAIEEALRGPLVRSGWLVLAAFSGVVASRISTDRTVSLVITQFAVYFALLCAGETIFREYASRRAAVLLGWGVGRRQHYLATCAAWLTVYLVGCWAFGLAFLCLRYLGKGLDGIGPLGGAFAIPVLVLPVLGLGFLLSTILPGWSNVAVLMALMLVLGIISELDESFGPLAVLARFVLGSSDSVKECLSVGGGADAALRAAGVLGGAVARMALFVSIGAWLVGSRLGRRRLGRAAAGARG
ncbi:MAG: hypothetical protein Kow0062_13190 [Acidobacteriota bacterium]|nr:MAG: hypothetical protein D6738_01075 [Acidobacteriota bacterium]